MGNIDLVDLLFTFQGRVNRGKFWFAALVYFVVGIGLAILSFILETIALGFVSVLIGGVVNLAIAISGIAIGIKRLHDRNKSGWWLLFFYLALPALVAIGFIFYDAALMAVLFLAAAAVFVWMFIELGCLRGTVGPNRFGADPVPVV